MSEIRRNDDGTVDEILACGFIHVEQMDDNQWWIGIDEAGKRMAFTLTARGKIKLTITDEPVHETKPADPERCLCTQDEQGLHFNGCPIHGSSYHPAGPPEGKQWRCIKCGRTWNQEEYDDSILTCNIEQQGFEGWQHWIWQGLSHNGYLCGPVVEEKEAGKG